MKPAATKPSSSDLDCPTKVDFGTVTKNSSGSNLTKTFTIRNTSSRGIYLKSYSVTGYTVSGADGTVAAGGSATVTVSLDNVSSVGTFDKNLNIDATFTDNDGTETTRFTVRLTATVTDSTCSITADPSTKDMGKLKEGYDDKAIKEKEVTVTIKNSGSTIVRLNSVKGDDHFTVTAVDDRYATLDSGKSVEFKVAPKKSLTPGTYTDTITFQTNEGATATFKPTVVVEKALAPLTVEPASLDFGTVEEGYAQVAEKTVTIKNNSEGAIRLEQPSSYSYEFSQLSDATVPAGGSVTMSVRPRTGMPQGSYKGEITISASNGERAALNVAFSVNRKAGPSTFTDVPADSTFAADIAYVSQQGLMGGKGEGVFKPGDPITRGQLVTILYRLEGQPAVSGTGFADVKTGSYCDNAVKWAAASGITAGNNEGLFQPDEPVSRQQLATFLYRYNNYKGYQIAKQADLSAFSDGDSVSSYARDALSWANGTGLVNGTSDGKLNPTGGASRGQAAAILHRFCVSIGR